MARTKLSYRKKYCKQLIDHCAKGLSAKGFCGQIGITSEKFEEWARDHAEFRDAIDVARSKSLDYWEQELVYGTAKIKKDVVKFVLAQRYNEVYSDKKKPDVRSEPTHVTFEVVDEKSTDATSPEAT